MDEAKFEPGELYTGRDVVLPEVRERGNYIVRVVVNGNCTAGRRLLRGVMRYARTHTRWWLNVETAPESPKGPEWALDEAVIYACPIKPLLDMIQRRPVPVINCLAHQEHRCLATVRVDDHAVGVTAGKFFIERGFRRFMFVRAGDKNAASDLRLAGFGEVLRDAGFDVELEPDNSQGQPRPDRMNCISAALRAKAMPVCVLVSHDTIARELTDQLAATDLIVPEQVAVLGVDNDELQCAISRPPLSSIDLPYEDLGHRAAELLDGILSRRIKVTEPIKTLLMPPSGVVERQSTDVVAFDEPRLAEALRFMRVHACDPCNVEDVLGHVLVSRRWLESQFKSRFGRTPHEEITRLRVEKAKYLLGDPRLPLVTIARRAGYGHVQNFVSVFRRTAGETPDVFRRKIREQRGV